MKRNTASRALTVPAEKALYVRAYVKLSSGEILYGDVKCITAPAMKGQ